jgi:hypothetical protein
MISNILIGASKKTSTSAVQIPSIAVDGESIIMNSTPSMANDGTSEFKVHVLLYNAVNRYGEVLSSIVAMTTAATLTSTEEFEYVPATLLNTSVLEKSLVKDDISVNTWLNKAITQSDITLLNWDSYKTTNTFKRFSTSTDFAPEVSLDRYMYDGWYTMVTVVAAYINDFAAVKAGTLRSKSISGTNTLQYALIDNPTTITDWSNMTSVTTAVPIAEQLTTSSNKYQQFDFFVLLKTNSLYNSLLTKKLSSEWFPGVSAIRPKLRSIYEYAKYKDFALCQHMINSFNLTLLST